MKTKLTKEDFKGYKDAILGSQLKTMKNRLMQEAQDKIVLPWLEEMIKHAKPTLQSRKKI